MTKKFMVDKFKKKTHSGRSYGKNYYNEFVKSLAEFEKYKADKIRGMETSLVIIDEDCPDFDLTMPCGPYGDED
jgi:hypothetical protein